MTGTLLRFDIPSPFIIDLFTSREDDSDLRLSPSYLLLLT